MPRGRSSLNKTPRSSAGSGDDTGGVPEEDFFALRSPAKRSRQSASSESASVSSSAAEETSVNSPMDKKTLERKVKCVEPSQPSDLPLAPLFVRVKRPLTQEERREKLAKDSAECNKLVARLTSDHTEMNPFFLVRQSSATLSLSSSPEAVVSSPTKEKEIPQTILWAGRTHVHQQEDSCLADITSMHDSVALSFHDEPDYDDFLRNEMDKVPVSPFVEPHDSISDETESDSSRMFEPMTEDQCLSEMDIILRHRDDESSETEALFEEFRRINTMSDKRSLLWSEKYHPRSQKMICGNAKCFSKLSKWLSKWATPAIAAGVQNSDQMLPDSLFPMFTKSDSEDSRDDIRTPNLFVVQGHGSCCKTAGVVACAEERGMEVIEINASECRSGKSVLQRTAEASASRQIAVTVTPPPMFRFDSGSGSECSTPDLKKMVGDDDDDDDDEHSSPSSASQKGLRRVFLFEDVDVFFDGDSGMHSAILSLVQTTNYPVVATCRELPVEVVRFKECGKFVSISPPPAQEIAFHALFFLLLECNLLALKRVPSDRCKEMICSVYALARFMANEMGLRGLSTFLQFWSSSMMWSNIRHSSLLYSHINLHYEDDKDVIARDLENAHAVGCDVGFDSWLHWQPTGRFSVPTTMTKEDRQLLADILWYTAEGFSVLDLSSSAHRSKHTVGTHLSRMLSGIGWRAPRQTLDEWSRLSVASCQFESAILTSFKRVCGITFHGSISEPVPWHVASDTWSPCCYRASAPSLLPKPASYKLLNPRQLQCIWGGARPPTWQLLCNATLGPFTAHWAAETLPRIRDICKWENDRRAAGRSRRFTHHLIGTSERENMFILAGGFSTDPSPILRCDCCLCPVIGKYLT